MSKTIIIAAAAASAFLFAAPAFAQSAPAPAPGHGFDGPHGSASNLRDAPSSDPTAARRPGFNGPHGSATDLRDAPRPSDDGSTARTTSSQYQQYLGRTPAPSAAQGHVKVFDGATGGPLRNAPASTARPGFDGPHGSATNLRDAPSSDPTAHRSGTMEYLNQNRQRELATDPDNGFSGRHGSATNLTDAPSSDPAAGYIKPAKLFGRKAGDDKRQDYARPAPRPTGGVTRVGAGGTLQATGAARMQSQNNLRQMGTANAPR